MSTPASKKLKVLFLCVGNSARSQMAEALLRKQAGQFFNVYSAGTNPEPVDPRAISALEESGINVDGLHSKPLSTFDNQHFDFVITLCDKANQECASFQNADYLIAWDFPDPKSRGGQFPFQTTLTEISNRIAMFVAVVTRSGKVNEHPFNLNPNEFFKCLTDEVRLKCLMLIQYEGELCVCELVAALDEVQPKISRNLAMLKKQKLLIDRRQGQWVFYKINPELPDWAKKVLATSTEANVSFLMESLVNLTTLGERPDRKKNSCCTPESSK